MSFLQVAGKPDVLPNDETAPPQQGRKGMERLSASSCVGCIFAARKSEKITRSMRGWRDLICMSQKHQINMSLTSKEVHEILGDVAVGCKDSADARGTRRAWGAWESLCSVRHQVLENTLA